MVPSAMPSHSEAIHSGLRQRPDRVGTLGGDLVPVAEEQPECVHFGGDVEPSALALRIRSTVRSTSCGAREAAHRRRGAAR